MFTILLGPQARKFLKKCESELRIRLEKELEKLAAEPFPKDVVRVIGREQKTFRVRVGGYRIKYVVKQSTNEILIFEIDKRDVAY